MNNEIKVSEIFETICSVGQNAGEPILVVKVDKEGKKYTVKQMIDILAKTHKGMVNWLGDDLMDYGDQIEEIINKTKFRDHQVQTNAEKLHPVLKKFDYVCFTPRNVVAAENCLTFLKRFVDLYWNVVDIAITTDIDSVGKELLGYASMLISSDESKKSKRKVWKYCVEHNLRYSPRLNLEIFGKDKEV